MPKVDQATYGRRKERVFLTLRRYPLGLTEAELEQITDIGRRTLNNYLRALETEGKIYKDGVVWAALPYDQVQLRKFDLSPEEAMTLYLATRLLVKQHDKRNEPAETALMKLATVLTADAGVGHEIHQAALELSRRPDDGSYSRIFRTVVQGTIYRRVLHITYEPSNGRPFETDFAPYLLEPSAIGFTTYAIGHSSIVNAWRTYKLERIREATLTRQEYTIPASFPGLEVLRSAWSIIYGEELVTVRLRFSPAVRQRVLETRWHPSQEEPMDDPDRPGYLLWAAQVADTLDMLPWVRGWGAEVEVLEPEELRRELARTARSMARLYDVMLTKSEPEIERLLQCWGKTGTETKDFHPALFHMLDVGHVAQVLLRPPASPRWRKLLARALGTEPETLGVWLPYVIAMHDIGKISAAFQSQNEVQHLRLKAQNFSFEPWRANLDVHHSQIGQAFVQQQPLSPIVPDNFRQVWVDMIGGHHGQFQPCSITRQVLVQLQKHEPLMWQQMRQVADRALQQHFLAPGLYTLPEPCNISTATMALTGFTILCDWLGSDGRFFPSASGWDLESYIQESRMRAERAVREAGFLQPTTSQTPMIFSELFPDKHPPRPLQAAIDAIPQEVVDGPCLAVIEAPTGEGKTEAALALAHRLAVANDTNELYYALPTTATSNQMFKRLREHLHTRLGLPVEVQLIHGQAFLLKDDLCIEPSGSTEGADRDAMIEWFTSKKRALLAPFGVGTVDQAELAALNVKHNALRLIGLAGKVVVFDEVHAYDTYMSTIVETLLQWLSALGTSVIILSATLPQVQRAALARAYGAEIQETVEQKDAYPSLWVLRPGYPAYQVAPPAQQLDRKLKVRTLHLPTHARLTQVQCAKARWLLDAIAGGGCACWITNTVERAQQLFSALTNAATPEVDLTLLHARFPLEERLRREEQLTNKYGPQGDRPGRGIVVGTQVLEQSLDLDFDVMVSDLAPIDLLLQRAGRLQRHDRKRPATYADHPTLWIHTQFHEGGEVDLSTDARIYESFLLQKTWLNLQAWGEDIQLPRDYRPLVEAIYGISEPPLDDSLIDMWRELQQRQSFAQKEARQRLIPEPDPEWSFCPRAAQLTFEEDETGAAWIVAQTRLGRESVNLIPMERKGEQASLYPSGETLLLDRPASKEMQLRLLRGHLRVSRPEIIRAVKNETLPPLFGQSARLKGYYPLWMNDGQAEFALEKGKLIVTLDNDLGLVIVKEKGV